MRGENHLVAGPVVFAAPEVLDRHADARPARMPEGQSGADRVADAVEIELAADLAVVAALGLLDPLQQGVERLLRRRGHPVEPLQHRVLLVAAVVGSGHRHEFDGADLAGAGQMRPAAEIGESAAAVEADRLARGNVGQAFKLVALTGEEPGRLVAGHLDALQGEILAHDPDHLGLDRRKILGRQPVGQVEIVVETLIRGGADVHLRTGIQPTNRRRHDMRGTMTQQFNRLHERRLHKEMF